MEGTEPDPFELAWRRVEAAWDDDDAHKRFIAFCGAQGALSEAGRRYRAVRDGDSERSESAKKRIDAVLAHAMQTMELTREPSVPGRGRTRTVLLAVVCGVFMIAALALLRAVSR